jgi:hypothetical protein
MVAVRQQPLRALDAKVVQPLIHDWRGSSIAPPLGSESLMGRRLFLGAPSLRMPQLAGIAGRSTLPTDLED